MTGFSKELGNSGEEKAADFLKNKGYRILERNYVPNWLKQGKKEIDIVAEKDGVLVFVEVKTSQEKKDFFPEDRVNFQKQRNLFAAAESYLMERKTPSEKPWQIDVIAVTLGGNGKAVIEHIENSISE